MIEYRTAAQLAGKKDELYHFDVPSTALSVSHAGYNKDNLDRDKIQTWKYNLSLLYRTTWKPQAASSFWVW